MHISELVKKLDAIGLYASNEDLMMLDYEGGNGTIEFVDDNGVGYHFPITDNHFDMNAAGHAVQICYRKLVFSLTNLVVWLKLKRLSFFSMKMSCSLDFKKRLNHLQVWN